MTPQSLKDVSTYLTPVLDEPTEQAMESLAELITFILPDVLFAATDYLPQNAKSKIQLLLSAITSPINSPVEAPADLHTPPHIYIKPRGGVQLETPIEPEIFLSMWMTPQSLKDVVEYLTPILTEPTEQAVESLADLLTFIPPNVLFAATDYLPKNAKSKIQLLLSQPNSHTESPPPRTIDNPLRGRA
ncbi:MAG TPA: hypothetical protein VE944_26750 [Nostoc sp.]|uniref:hypothetical protein n=1 Tax=Nostoc sp. TaxID=1180 RepID=UPI002D6F622E|nr:hypothetical protein [Nostoc sp.]HYX17895.1 hypothetical protein [Nostoc sp.]